MDAEPVSVRDHSVLRRVRGRDDLEGQGPTEMVQHWYDGFWAFLTFAMQMVLIIMTGFVIAYHPRVNDALRRLASIPNSSRQAVVLVGVVSMGLAWIHWGLSLVVGAIFAREMGRAPTGRGSRSTIRCSAWRATWDWGSPGTGDYPARLPSCSPRRATNSSNSASSTNRSARPRRSSAGTRSRSPRYRSYSRHSSCSCSRTDRNRLCLMTRNQRVPPTPPRARRPRATSRPSTRFRRRRVPATRPCR